ncbi:unnamed protein product [Cuscuta campestris]|uniref:Reverse transcriptase domain-containing protein n=1 Tax=Cuscuta campestris TaxID=132261 RepID=A0A484L0G4_9ASTE|nr:unnamed protein product [Cuscuta campestris]
MQSTTIVVMALGDKGPQLGLLELIIKGIGYGLQGGLGGSGGWCTTRACAVCVSGLLPEGAVGDHPKLRHLCVRAGKLDVGGHDDIHDEESVGQASLGGNGSAIHHVDHDELCPIDVGVVDDCMNGLQVLDEERGVATVPGAENLGEEVEKKTLLRRGRVDRQGATVADEVGDPKLLNDDRLVLTIQSSPLYVAMSSPRIGSPAFRAKATSLGPKPFRFLNAWTLHDTFLDRVKTTWASLPTIGDMRGLANKLLCLKATPKAWNQETFGNIFSQLQKAEEHSLKEENDFENNPTQQNKERMQKANADLVYATNLKAAFQKDKSIDDHILMEQEAVHILHKKVFGGSLILKLDMAKAFDKLDWVYLEALLKAFGFNNLSTPL